tara:strand:+ start:2663 stop:3760 length:1098 start_codon:yes stop_codon:yes gene_type:complete
MKVSRPTLSDSPVLREAHKVYYKRYPKKGYYEELIYISHNPIFLVADDKNNLLGYVASRVTPSSSKVYIVSLAIFNESAKLVATLINNLISASIDLDAKRIEMHIRGNKKNIISIFEKLGFESKYAGNYKDGDEKILLYLNLPEGKDKLTLPTYKKTKGAKATPTPTPKKKPKKGYYEISRARESNLSQVVTIHNKNIVKKRTRSYFEKILKTKPSFFWVAVDSNGDTIGYLAARPERIEGVSKGKYTKLNFVSMAIEKNWRKLGVAKALINKMLYAVENIKSIEYIYGHVRGGNKGARKLYRKLGFRERQIGIYQDDDDIKYEIVKRYRLPSIMPYWGKYKDYIVWFAMGIVAHETFTLISDDD